MSAGELKAMELSRLRAMGIEPMRMIVRNGFPVAVIDEATALTSIEEAEWRGIGGMFLVVNDPIPGRIIAGYTAIDNRDGYCWCEDFWTSEAALDWLTDEGKDTDRCHVSDLRRVSAHMDDVVPRDHPDRPAFERWVDRVLRAWDTGHQTQTTLGAWE